MECSKSKICEQAGDTASISDAERVEMPRLREFAPDLTRISKVRLVWSLLLPFIWVGLYVLFAYRDYWGLAVGCLVCLSFITYGSISHDLVHANLGLPRRMNDFFLTVIELAAIRSGHAYRLAHLRHHAIYPREDDIEGAAARMSLVRTLAEGVLFQPKIWWWAVRQKHTDRPIMVAEGIGCAVIVVVAVAFWAVAPAL